MISVLGVRVCVMAPAAGGALLLSLVLFASLLAPALGGVAADPLTLPRLGISGAGANKFALFAGGYTNAYAIPYHPISVLLVLGLRICDESAVTSSADLMSSSFVPCFFSPPETALAVIIYILRLAACSSSEEGAPSFSS